MFELSKFDVARFDSILARGLSHGLGKRGSQVCIEVLKELNSPGVALLIGEQHANT